MPPPARGPGPIETDPGGIPVDDIGDGTLPDAEKLTRLDSEAAMLASLGGASEPGGSDP